MKEYIVEYGVDDICELGKIVGRPNCTSCPHCEKISNNFLIVGPKGSYESIKITCNYERKKD